MMIKTLKALSLLATILSCATFAQPEPINLCDKLKALPADQRVYAGQDGWLLRSSDFKEDFSPKNSLPYLVRLNEALASVGVELVVAIIPLRSMVYPQIILEYPEDATSFSADKASASYNDLIAELESAGIQAPNLLEVATAMSANEFYFYKLDHHWTGEGARYSAEAVAEVIKKSEHYATLEKVPYKTTLLKEREASGSAQEIVEETCATPLQSEVRKVYQTVSTSADGLFGDVTYPVSLVGTSFSGHNLDGFLSETLQLPVLNYAVAGGGAYTAIQAYLSSDDFQNQKPSYLVWEFSAHHGFRELRELKQLIPSVYGVCKDSVYSAEVTLAPTVTVLDETVTGALPSASYYMVLEIPDVTVTDFAVNTVYTDGDKSKVVVSRSTRGTNNGRFFVELNDSPTKHLQTVSIEMPGSISSAVTVLVCSEPE